ncbi:hypothetical protein CRE_14501 [Caenorhabditis remanei]|uniref:F-box associated domain-containing protein n=1 Tax=Caenorhabditis remanei TaxID=31234 RepID=E3M986_CAERE|nr:hypothetical protein CRE_14501 [Caenorhabditis remanei]
MENQEVLRSKPLSYEASKAVLKSLSLEKREHINRRIPELRTINSRLPYVLVNVVITSATFETNGRRWYTKPAWVQSAENRLVPIRDEQTEDGGKSELTILQDNSRKAARYRVNKSPEKILEQLFDEYIRDGTVVSGSLCLCGIPEFLKGTRFSDLKMKVKNLNLRTLPAEDYEHFIRFIDFDALENVKLVSAENSLAILDKPEIQNCRNLTVTVHRYFVPPSVDQLLRLRNQHLHLEDYRFNLHELQLFVETWITTGREIGTRFSWEQIRFEDVLGILEHLKTHFGADEAGSNLEYYFSSKTIYGNRTLKMREDRELVMYCDKSKIQSERFTNYLWVFEMEVVASTTAACIVPIHDV